MPMYEYKCEDCGYQFEKIVATEHTPVVDCPNCEGSNIKKLITGCSFQFKGTGFHETDYKNQGK